MPVALVFSGALARNPALRLLLVFFCLGQAGGAHSPAFEQDLHAQSTAAMLARRFSSPDLSFYLLDEKGVPIASRWDNANREIAVGSLIKPFIAVAYGRTHAEFPRLRCYGGTSCWRTSGHGTLGLAEAIAFSCNAYFQQLAPGLDSALALQTFEGAGLSANGDGPGKLAGLKAGHGWNASPASLAWAYWQLASHSGEKPLRAVFQGMALSAQKGTAKEAGIRLRGVPAMAKTGTAPCIHVRKAPGDGFAVLMAPADHPRFVLLVRMHGRPGSYAAGVAGRIMAAITESGSIPEKK